MMKSIFIAATIAFLNCGYTLAEAPATNGTLIVTTNAPAKSDKPRQLYEDHAIRILAVDYGHHTAPQTPGFYVQGRKNHNWIRVEKVSLRDSVLGRSPTFEECRAAGTSPCSIGWDFSSLAKQDFVDFPLKSGGFLFFPDRIERDEEKGQLVLRFNSGWKIAGVETVLRVALNDLESVLQEK
jgi:hypothetical protein